MTLRISPSALRAFLECPRRWWLQSVARAARDEPAYLKGGLALDAAVQHYLAPEPPGGNGGAPVPHAQADDELRRLRAILPTPGTVHVQPKLELEDGPFTWQGTLDYLDTSSDAAVVIGDIKRVYAPHAAHTPESLEADIQAQFYAWLVWRLVDVGARPLVGRWLYYVRSNKKSHPVTCIFDRDRVDAWFESVVCPAAERMLALRVETDALQLQHDPDSCESGARCFVRASCPIFEGRMVGDENMSNLDSFIVAVNPPVVTTEPVLATTVEASPEALAMLDVDAEPDPVVALSLESERLNLPRVPAPDVPVAEVARKRKPRVQAPADAADLTDVSTEALCVELRCRGWNVALS